MTQSYAGRKAVWILGSGFSKSLGGPLLTDLLSHRGQAHVSTRHPGIKGNDVYPLYRRHLRGADESRGKPIYWDHAEEFLDFIDAAQKDVNPARYEILGRLLHPDWDPATPGDPFEALRTQARRCVAAECSFANQLSGEIEAIEPYVHWGASLSEHDTIISFNYDLVLETLGDARKEIAFGRPTVALVRNRDELVYVRGARCTTVLKVHGSVDWVKSSHGLARQEGGDTGNPFIATPGPGKYNACRGPLKPIWDAAAEALQEADVIVFMGYRFPPSDSQARTVLLNAIRRNRNLASAKKGAIRAEERERRHLRVHTVLGPRTSDDDTVRLLKLLEHTLRGAGAIARDQRQTGPLSPPPTFDLVPQPLYVEDFLTVIHNRELYGPPG